MPSDLSYWIISAPLKDGDPGLMLMDVRTALGDSVEVGQWELPELKVGHLVCLSNAYQCAMLSD
jgi:V-type H+-transporting ATPase subunit C